MCGRPAGRRKTEEILMGKGDKRTRRGKIFAGSYGKTRPKSNKTTAPGTAEEKPATKSRKKAEPAGQ
jgi:30S ribosomal protein S31